MRRLGWMLRAAAAGCLALAPAAAGAQPDRTTIDQARNPGHLFYEEAAFHIIQGNYLKGAAYALAAQSRGLRPDDETEAGLQLANAYAGLDLLDAAALEYQQVLDRRVPAETRNRIWYRIAQANYHNGDYAGAEAALRKIRGLVPRDLKPEVDPLLARTLMRQGRYPQAVETVKEWSGPTTADAFMRYNLGVALLRSGQEGEGMGQLFLIGEQEAESEELKVLRDRANLALGFYFLERGQGATSRAMLEKVRLNGPFSNRALLGLGWAEIAPEGSDQERVLKRQVACMEDPARMLPENLPIIRRIPRDACGAPKKLKSVEEFETRSGGETEQARWKQALIPWSELRNRDPRDPAVQEALLAIPYALVRAGTGADAASGFRETLAKYEAERGRLTALRQRLKATRLNPGDAPDGDEGDWLLGAWGVNGTGVRQTLAEPLSGHAFRQHAGYLRSLVALNARLEDWDRRLARLQLAAGDESTAHTAAGTGQRLFAALDTVPAMPEKPADDRRLFPWERPAVKPPPGPAKPAAPKPSAATVQERRLAARITSLQQQVERAIARYEQSARALLIQALDQRLENLDTYITRARLGLAEALGAGAP